MVIHHIDLNHCNNKLSNLKLMTHLEHNRLHKELALDLEKIYQDYKKGYSTHKLAIKYNCAQMTIVNRLKKAGYKLRTKSKAGENRWRRKNDGE